MSGLAATLDPRVTWYLARAAGLVTWALCAASILWGLALSTRIRRRGLPAWLFDLHTFLGGAALVFCAIHLAALAADDYVSFGPAELFVPMVSTWKPGAVAWGIVAADLLLAVEVTSLLRRVLPRKLWRSVHLSSAALFVAGTVHGITAGTDWPRTVVQVGAVGVILLVVLATGARLVRRERRRAPERRSTRVGSSDRREPVAAGVDV